MSLSEITSRHEAMIRRLVIEGATANEVCAEFDITPSRLSVIRATPIWRQKEDEMRKECFRSSMLTLESLRGDAIVALKDTVNDDDPRIRLASAKEILSRTGFASSINIEGEVSPSIKLYIPKGWNPGQGESDSAIEITSDSASGVDTEVTE